ncbi:unnamed protein product [Caenorhabditis auriculariae]|uniref:Uncharacterized protein n=1 Tax=Caenorhabditis auriculariae TaxID=2777116 RepID=A0A8S1HHY8_9PELO|nr:unnamed protein product [Caenorhabditis auriculariae]
MRAKAHTPQRLPKVYFRQAPGATTTHKSAAADAHLHLPLASLITTRQLTCRRLSEKGRCNFLEGVVSTALNIAGVTTHELFAKSGISVR